MDLVPPPPPMEDVEDEELEQEIIGSNEESGEYCNT